VASPIEVSDSQFKSFTDCERKWAYVKLLDLSPDEDKDTLIMGNAWHDGAEEFVKTGSMDKAIVAVMNAIAKDKPSNAEYQKLIVPAMLMGWASFWLPGFLKEYEFVALEEWFSVEPNSEIVRIRGYKDVVAKRRVTGRRCVFDYKTSSQAYLQDLTATLDSNNQLARYATAERRVTGEWPEIVGLVFACKPKAKNPMVAAQNARSDPGMYRHIEKQVTPQFAAFALAVEANDVLVAQRMQAYRDMVKQHGPAALDYIPANFNNCFNYGKFCGFAQGCHSACPAHTKLARK
jgi:hypothetical protein